MIFQRTNVQKKTAWFYFLTEKIKKIKTYLSELLLSLQTHNCYEL